VSRGGIARKEKRKEERRIYLRERIERILSEENFS